MKCLRCKKPSKEQYCRRCFMIIIEKRIRKHIRDKKLFKKGQKILATDKLSEYFLQRIITMPAEIVYRAVPKKRLNEFSRRFDVVVLPITLDDKLVDFLKGLFSKKAAAKKQPKLPENIVSLFETTTEDELARYAACTGIKFSKKRSELNKMLDKLEQKYPGSKFSFAKAIERTS